MKKELSEEEKYIYMTETPVEKLIGTLAIPTIVSMLITSIYNMADTYFVGQISTTATGAVGISFALMSIIQALGFMIGSGSGNYVSRLLGRRKIIDAEKVASTGLFSVLILGFVLMTIGLVFLDSVVKVLGATDTIFPYAKIYVRYILIGMPFMASALYLNILLRFQGSSFYGMLGIGTGGLINILLDPIFIFKFSMGIGGAALATILSQFISFLILLYFCGRHGILPISWKKASPDKAMYMEIMRGGFPSFCRQGIASISTAILNLSAAPYGDGVIAAMSIVNRIFHFAIAILLGFGQGFQPVCGFNYGAKRYDRVLNSYRFCVKVALAGLTVLSVIGFLGASNIVALFRRDDIEVITLGAKAIRLQCLVLPLSAWIIMDNMLLQMIRKTREASILAASKQGICFIPAILILPRIFGVLGIQISQPIADIITLIIGIIVIKEPLRELELLKKAQSNIILNNEGHK